MALVLGVILALKLRAVSVVDGGSLSRRHAMKAIGIIGEMESPLDRALPHSLAMVWSDIEVLAWR